MDFHQGTLQDWFYEQEQNLNVFPDKKNYISYYKTFKDFLDRDIHPNIGTVMSREEPCVFLNDHSEKHVAMVIDKATHLLAGLDEANALSPYEAFFLLMAIQIHDAGHIVNADRDTHAEDSRKIIQEIDKHSITAWEKHIIFDIAKAHSGKDDLISKQKISDGSFADRIRYRFISAVLRMADELSDGKYRAANYLLEKEKLPVESRIYHSFSSCLEIFKIDIEGHEVSMTFCLNTRNTREQYTKQKKDGASENVFLINEIYLRSLKTFNECMYYNRFVPENMRISSVTVEINFLDAESMEYFFPTIKYHIEEKGYPTLSSYDIFDICKDELYDDGNKLDGQYIANQINNNKR
jgi:hypothetical protein